MYAIEFLEEALKEFKALDKPIQKRIKEKPSQLAHNPDSFKANIKALKGKHKNNYRLKVGNYRIIYVKEDEKLIILIVRIGHRKKYLSITQKIELQGRSYQNRFNPIRERTRVRLW